MLFGLQLPALVAISELNLKSLITITDNECFVGISTSTSKKGTLSLVCACD